MFLLVFFFYICRVLPKFIPLWLAPVLVPYWREITVWPARNCSSVNSRSFLSASLGPIEGFPYLDACFQFENENENRCLTGLLIGSVMVLTLRPSDWRQMMTELRFCFSHRSTVWKSSWVGTPKDLAASKNMLMFSMHLNAILLCWIFLTVPGWISLASLWSTNQIIEMGWQSNEIRIEYILAQKGSITQVLVNVIGVTWHVIRFTGQSTNPFQHFLGVRLAVFAVDLRNPNRHPRHISSIVHSSV